MAATTASKNLVQKAYIAYYGRAADPRGLEYWAARVDSEGGLASVMNAFGTSAEATALQSGLSNAAKVNSIYQYLFGRDADATGLDYYTTRLDNGTYTLATIAYNIIESLFDRMQISLAFEDLVDAKTRLKETVDAFKTIGPVVNGRHLAPLGDIQYRSQRNQLTKMHIVTAVRIESRGGRPMETPLGTGNAHILKDAEQQAAKMALDKLKSMGYYNAPKDSYSRFCRY